MTYLNRAMLAKTIKNIQVTLALVSALILLITAAPLARAGELDFLVAIDDSSNLYYALSNGDGTFSNYHYLDYLGGNYSRGVTINDFNNDGFLDIVAGRGIGGTAYYYLFLNDGSNNFTKTGLVGTLSNAGTYAMDMSSGDFNNDGRQDFIANGDSTNTGIFLGDGAGGFTRTEMNLGSRGRGLDVADFDHDGNLDFARASSSYGYTYIHPGNGDGTFGDVFYVDDTGNDPYGLVAGDFNNDGLVDLIINSGGGGDPYFFAGNGDFTFADSVYVPSLDFDNHGAYDGYDYNGDGNLDLVAVNYTGRRVYFYPGNGDGTFGTAVDIGGMSGNSIGDSAQPIGPPAGVPTAIISPSSATIAAGGSVDFDGSGSSDDGSIVSWDWDFDDGGLDTVENPAAHTYADEGAYYPTLKVTDDDGKSDIAPAKVIVQGDTPAVDTTPVEFDEALADGGVWDLNLDGADYASDTEGLVSYQWDLGDGFSDDFEDENADGWTPYAGTWDIFDADAGDGTAFVYQQTDTGANRAQNLFDKIFDGDITIEADITLVSGSGQEAQILFQAKDQYNNYEYILRGRGNNDILFYRRVNNGAANLFEYDLPESHPSYPITDGNTYHVKIVIKGPQFDFYLDDVYLFTHWDSTFQSGKVGFSTYRSQAYFDNLVVTTQGSGQTVAHKFEAGTYNVDLTVKDAAEQSANGIIPMTMQPGDQPAADPNGPYAADETDADQGGWTFTLDGSGSTDDVEIRKYIWDFGLDSFDGAEFNFGKWYTNGGVSQAGMATLSGVNTWNTKYIVTNGATFPKVKGQIFEAKFMVTGGGRAMFGFKNSNTGNFHYNQFPYEFYLYNGNIYIHENSNNRGDTYYNYAYNIWYDFRIELKETGAIYSYRASDSSAWIVVYNSDYPAADDTQLRKGIVVYSGTWSMDDFRENTAGISPDFTLYKGTGAFNVVLTVYDRANQSHTAGTTVEITDGDPPVANAGSDQAKNEADASDGNWSVTFDGSGSSDDTADPLYSYEWDWDYDGSTFNPSGDTGVSPTHSWSAPGTYLVAIRVADHALQTSIDTMNVVISQGGPPAADAKGPYAVDEDTGNAFEGGWTVSLDGSASSDADSGISRYLWDMGTDTFNGTVINEGKWHHGTDTSQNDAISITGVNNWDTRYIFSKDIYSRAKGMALEAAVKHTAGYAMVGFKNTNTNYSYTQMPYAIYFNYGNLLIYEYGGNRGDTGYDYSYDTWYDVRIELKVPQGARYYYRESGSPTWILIYDSDNYTDADFKRGVTVNSGTFTFDDMREIAAGPTPTYRFYGLGDHTIQLTVYDQSLQSGTDSTIVTTSSNDAPVADAGGNKAGGELDAVAGEWTFTFDGAGSTDDHAGIYKYEWDWDYDGTFEPSGDTSATPSHGWSSPGAKTVALRVIDHALQSSIDTLAVNLTIGASPVAVAGPDVTTEGHWPVVLNAGGSTDDLGIYKYEWDFGDFIDIVSHSGPTTKSPSVTPKHLYWETGDYNVTLTVYDNAMQSSADTLTVHVITGDPPVADAGGPYNAGAGGPPAYFNGSLSTDDYGIVKYLWDVDNAVDSDGDSNFTNDIDVVGRLSFHTYASAGTYTATLTVVDGAGQTSTDTATVNVAANLAPDVIAVPWRSGDPTIPHETYNGRSIRLKAIVRDAGTLTYQWDFGGGTLIPASPATVTDNRAIELAHTFPDSADETPYTVTLTVWDSDGLMASDKYYVIVKPDDLDTRTNIAIDEGLWYQHKAQYSDGHWDSPGVYSGYSSYFTSPTASAIHAFEINAHLQSGDSQENPYVETVVKGLNYMFTKIGPIVISEQTYGNPDTNGNGIGIEVKSGRPIYEGGMVMDAIASSNAPLAFAATGPENVKGRFYHHILTDMVDAYAWGQYDSATLGGGWRYGWNQAPDNSANQWAAIGMLAAEDNFGINVPQWVKTRNNVWLTYSYDGTGFGYTGPGNGVAQTPSGMVQLAFNDLTTSDPRWRTAEDYIANNWFWQSGTHYGAYSLVKALRLAQPVPVVNLQATGLDWYDDPVNGVRKWLVDKQFKSDSAWGAFDSDWVGRIMNTAYGIIMLTPSLFVQPPVADAGSDIIWAYDLEITFDASGSFHLDPSRHIVKYEWDFDGDGTYDFTTSDPSDPNAKFTYADPDPEAAGDLPRVINVKLRVTDDNDPFQTDIDIREVTAAEPPHAPFASSGGPYTVTVGIPFTLDASGSSDIDPGDRITRYEWDLDDDGVFFDDVDIDTTSATVTYVYNTWGQRNIGLRVTDAGVFNPLDCTIGEDCIPMQSVPDFTTVTVGENQAPTADPNGPYTVDEGTPLTLDGTGSADPNGDALSFAWDLDGDGELDDSTVEQPTFTYNDNGVYDVTLEVSDSLLDDTASTTVTVNNVAPVVEAGPDQTVNEGQTVNFAGSFVDPGADTHTFEWDFGDGTPPETETLTPTHVYADNGSYTVELCVTDDDGGSACDELVVTVDISGSPYHSADYNPADWKINLSELLRGIQFYNIGELQCDPQGEDGFGAGAGDQTCAPHDSDYNPQDWSINLSELLRLIQLYNIGEYHYDPEGEDGYAPGAE